MVTSEAQVHFIASSAGSESMLDRLRSQPAQGPMFEVALASCPGYAVIDSGCGRTIIGADTLRDFTQLLEQKGITKPLELAETHQFKFGNGCVETSHRAVSLPVQIAGQHGIIKASVVRGQAPLLLSRTALKTLN